LTQVTCHPRFCRMNQTITNAHPAKADASVSWFDTLASGVDLTMDRMLADECRRGVFCPSSDGRARLSSAGSSDASTTDA
jgi:hypothetical protein